MDTMWGKKEIDFLTVEKEQILAAQKKTYQFLLIFNLIIFTILVIFTLQFISKRNLVQVSIWNGTPDNYCSIVDDKIILNTGEAK